MSINRPVIAVAVCVIKDSKILLGKRKKTPEIDSWQLPGGLLNDKETVFESSLRVVSRKVGVHIEDLDSGPYTNNIFTQPDYHSVSLYVSARYISGDVDASNYDQAEDWQWFGLDEIPEALFMPLRLLLDNHKDWLVALLDESISE